MDLLPQSAPSTQVTGKSTLPKLFSNAAIPAGAALAWNSNSLDEKILANVLSRDVFEDDTGKIAKAGFKLGFAHQKLGVKAVNETPLGTVLAAPQPAEQELFCRNGLKWFAKIPQRKILAVLKTIQKQRAVLQRSAEHPLGTFQKQMTTHRAGARRSILVEELELAARMAEQSCQFMLWQEAVVAKNTSEAKRLAQQGIRKLQKLEKDFNAYWPMRNKATPKHCTPFLKWRMEDYRRGGWA